MQTITNSGIRNLALALAMVLVVALSVAVTPKAQAADLSDYGWVTDSIDQYYTPSYDSDYGWVTDSIDQYYTPDYYSGGSDYGWVTDSVDQYYTPGYSYSTPSYSYPSYGSSGIGGFTGMGGTGGQSQSQSQSQSSSNTNVNNNVNNVNVNVPTAQPTVIYQQVPYTYTPPVYVPPVQYDMCPNIAGIQSVLPSGYYIQNGYCYQTYIQPPVYQQPVQPYVTLSSVPYTGLELGPVGTALYWGFLVLWCLFAAYMIAVKRVQNTFVAWLTGGKKAHAHTAHVAHAVHAPAHKVEHKAAVQHSGIDPFIASQIGR